MPQNQDNQDEKEIQLEKEMTTDLRDFFSHFQQSGLDERNASLTQQTTRLFPSTSRNGETTLSPLPLNCDAARQALMRWYNSNSVHCRQNGRGDNIVFPHTIKMYSAKKRNRNGRSVFPLLFFAKKTVYLFF